MRLITTPEKLSDVFKRLCEQYEEYYWLTYNLDIGRIKSINPQKIRLLVTQCICGVDEYEKNNQYDNSWNQIAKYYNDNCGNSFFWIRGRFISEESDEKSKFHSKVYFFRNNDKEWEAIIGSSNLTASGFEMIQSSVLFGNEDDSDGTLYDQIIELISKKWADNVYLTNHNSRIKNKENYEKWKRQFETKFKDWLVHYSCLNSNNTQIKVEALPLPD